MRAKKTLGQELVHAVRAALASKEKGTVVRPKMDVAAIRKHLHMTQQEFSEQYHIKLQTLRNWEQHKRVPDTASMAYLTCIVRNPRVIKKLLDE